MSLSSYQKQVDKLLQVYEKPYWAPLSQYARMVEEVGELGRELNARYGDKPKKSTEAKANLDEELADVIFTVICLANAHGVDLDVAMKRILDKLQTRDKNRFARKKG